LLDLKTQFAWLDSRFTLRKHFKSRYQAANVSRLNEVVATNKYFSDIPSLDVVLLGHLGTTMVQLFCGCQSFLTSVLEGRKHLGYYQYILPVIKG
jgi:hypothetical protein